MTDLAIINSSSVRATRTATRPASVEITLVLAVVGCLIAALDNNSLDPPLWRVGEYR